MWESEISFQWGEVTRICIAAVVQASVREEKKLMVENAKLKNDIEELKKQLLEKEKKRGGMLSLVPSKDFYHKCVFVLKKTLMLLSSLYLVIEVVVCACHTNI